MDYEKKYNEALKRFKSFKEKYYTKDTNLGDVIFDKNGEMQKDFNGIFPELAESEDEKNWKIVMEYVKDDALREWLKKQKEPHYTKRNALFDKCVAECDPWVMQRVSDEIDEMLEKEQKPAEWSEEDERMLSRCEKSIESSKQFADSDTFKKAKDNEIDWLENRFKSLRPSWKSSEVCYGAKGDPDPAGVWKPTEEQMEALLNAEKYLNAGIQYGSAKRIDELIKQLKEERCGNTSAHCYSE